jgi:hypothetical protein
MYSIDEHEDEQSSELNFSPSEFGDDSQKNSASKFAESPNNFL